MQHVLIWCGGAKGSQRVRKMRRRSRWADSESASQLSYTGKEAWAGSEVGGREGGNVWYRNRLRIWFRSYTLYSKKQIMLIRKKCEISLLILRDKWDRLFAIVSDNLQVKQTFCKWDRLFASETDYLRVNQTIRKCDRLFASETDYLRVGKESDDLIFTQPIDKSDPICRHTVVAPSTRTSRLGPHIAGV